MSTFIQLLVAGVTIGSVYVLLALGWVLLYRVADLIFLIIGEFAVLGALLASTLVANGWALLPAILAAVAISIVVVLIIDFGLLRRLPHMDHLLSVLLMIGLSFLLADLFRRLFGGEVEIVPSFLPTEAIEVAGASILPHQLLLIGVTAVFTALLWWVLQRTLFGRAMSACAESEVGAQVCGISPRLMRTLSLVIAVGIASIGGILLGTIQPTSPASGLNLSTLGFIAAAVGLWTFPGAVVAGLLIGCIQSFGAGYVSSVYQEIFVYAALMIALVFATLRWSPAMIRKRLESV